MTSSKKLMSVLGGTIAFGLITGTGYGSKPSFESLYGSDNRTSDNSIEAVVPNFREDKANYSAPGQCEDGSSSAIVIRNKTTYPIYYDLSGGGAKKLTDWRIKPGKFQNHCREASTLEFDYDFNSAGIQIQEHEVSPSQEYSFIETSDGILDLVSD